MAHLVAGLLPNVRNEFFIRVRCCLSKNGMRGKCLMKFDSAKKEFGGNTIKHTAQHGNAVRPGRRITDITPACSELSESRGVPTSPKIHELIERSRLHRKS